LVNAVPPFSIRKYSELVYKFVLFLHFVVNVHKTTKNYFRNNETLSPAPVPGIHRKGAVIGERYINKPLL